MEPPRSREEWTGKVIVLNFWASWCGPCREEMPTLIALQNQFGASGVQFVGIAIDDPKPASEFVATYGVNFPTLLGNTGTGAIELAKRLGDHFGGLPFTVVAKADGEIVLRHPGELRRARLAPLLRELTASAAKS